MSSQLHPSNSGSDARPEPTIQPCTRRDPLQILPLELVINIMQHGLDKDRYFALKNSWVSRLWRSTLNDSCPELWSTFQTSPEEMQNKSKGDKREAWVRRSQGRFTDVRLKRLNLRSIGQLPKTLHEQFKSVENLSVDVKTLDVMLRFVDTHNPATTFPVLKRLSLHGSVNAHGSGPYYRTRRQIPAGQPVHCDVIGTAARETLEDLEVTSMYYQCVEPHPGHTAAVPEISRFPSLRNFCLKSCVLDYTYPSPLHPLPEAERQYQQDPIHDLLRGADQLTSIEILPYASPLSDIQDCVPRPQLSKRVEMPCLLSAIIPPPIVWAIDILAPRLETLIFRMNAGRRGRRGEPLIPVFEDAPVPFERFGKLKVVEFACSDGDDISHLKAWLSQLESVNKLVVSNSTDRWFPETESYDPVDTNNPNGEGLGAANDVFRGDARASMRFIQLLADCPELCPKLEELEFRNCYTNGRSLVEFVRRRKAMKGYASIQRVGMSEGAALSKKAIAAIQAVVPVVDVHVFHWQCKCHLYQNDDFDFDMPPDWGGRSDDRFSNGMCRYWFRADVAKESIQY